MDGEAAGCHRRAVVEHQAVPGAGVMVVDAEPRLTGVLSDDRTPRLEPEGGHSRQHVAVVAVHPFEPRHDHNRNRPSSKRLMNDPNPIRPAACPTE